MTVTATEFDSLQDDIREVNLSYLLVARQLVRLDFEAGCLKLGVDAGAGEVLRDLSFAQIRSLADTSFPVVALRIKDAELLRSLSAGSVNRVVQRMRTMTALAQAPVAAIHSN